MTWREFQLRKIGYERQNLEQWKRVREIAYWSGAGTAFDASKVKPNRFMPLGEEQSVRGVSDKTKERFRQLQREYLEKTNGRR